MRTLYLLDTLILTGGAGVYRLKKITLEEARDVIRVYDECEVGYSVKSALRHTSTAQVMTALLGRLVEVCHDAVVQDVQSQVLCFKLKQCPPEGTLTLSVEEIEKIGYEWFLLQMELEGAAEDRSATLTLERLTCELEEKYRLVRCHGLKQLLSPKNVEDVGLSRRSLVNAQISALPEPLKLLHGPIMVTLETWSDGSVIANWPATALFGVGEHDVEALEELTKQIFEFAKDIKTLAEAGEIAGPLLRCWRSFSGLVNSSALLNKAGS